MLSETRDRVWYATLSNPSELNGVSELVLEHVEGVCESIECDDSFAPW